MKCPICAQELEADAVFCSKCGKKVPRCPTCGEILYERSRFCGNDGTPLPAELFADFPDEIGEEQVTAEISAVVAQALSGDVPSAPKQTAPVPQPAARPAVEPRPPAAPGPAARPAAKPAARPVVQSAPQPQPVQKSPAPPKKKKKSGTNAAVIVLIVVLLLAVALAIAAGTYFVVKNGLPSFGGGADVSSSEDSSREDQSEPEDSGDQSEDEDQSKNQDEEIETALETAEEYAEDGDYEKALNTIQDALEENSSSRKLKRAQKEYIEAFETDILARAAELAENAEYPAAIQLLQAAQEVLDEESERLADKQEEYEELQAAEQAAQENRVPAISMDHITDVYASSYLSEPSVDLYHIPGRVLDGDLSTAWVEGVDGIGTGESITLEFDGTYRVSGLKIHAGYQKSENLYSLNARPALLTATFSDGTQQIVYLQDVNGAQSVSLNVPVETQYVTLTISSVYPGTTYEDTVISELSFY